MATSMLAKSMRRCTLEVKEIVFRKMSCIVLRMTSANEEKNSPAGSLLELCCNGSSGKVPIAQTDSVAVSGEGFAQLLILGASPHSPL